jgi:hypothetical protein
MREGNMLGALGMLAQKSGGDTDTFLRVIAAVLVIAGIVALVRGSASSGSSSSSLDSSWDRVG